MEDLSWLFRCLRRGFGFIAAQTLVEGMWSMDKG